MQIINPATQEVLDTIVPDTQASIHQKFEAAKAAQTAWYARPFEERLACIQRFYEALALQEDTLAATLTAEVGKPLTEARNEIKGARLRIAWFLQHSTAALAPETVTPNGPTQEHLTYEPLGVIANISAWNYPYLVGVNVFIPALIAGNAVLYKPSEYATLTGLHIARLLHEAGVPPAIFALVAGNGQAGQALLQVPCNGYFFTGSYATGQRIAQAVAGRMVPCQLELGGKDPLYVMDDVADITATAAAVLEGFMYNAGQSCCAVERVYVQRPVYEAFMEALVQQAAAIKQGNPLLPTTQLGPLCRPGQVAFLQQQVKQALAMGAQIAYQGATLPPPGYYFPLTILTQVHHGMQVMTEESFGPLIGIQVVDTDAEAVSL
ncbi:MAG TPA: aldehyde dehydrogenase family protein, partial [Phnomibacter sp.]|nr:aldehyde dehydrogenase family protein [Phnomibacter sp.]